MAASTKDVISSCEVKSQWSGCVNGRLELTRLNINDRYQKSMFTHSLSCVYGLETLRHLLSHAFPLDHGSRYSALLHICLVLMPV